MFTSNVLNEEQNAPLFESVLTTQYSIHLDDSQSVPVEFVLELSDCDAFVNLFDRNGKGWISLDDLMVALMPHSLSSIKSTDESHLSLSLTGETAGFGKESASESLIRALLAKIITSESIFLTKIQGKSLRQLTLARGTPALETKQIFDELCDYGS